MKYTIRGNEYVFLRLFRSELCNNNVHKLIANYTYVLQTEIRNRNTFYFPANKAHKDQRRTSIRNLINDMRELRRVREDIAKNLDISL